MKKIILSFLMICLCCIGTLAFSGCGNTDTPPHTHVFTEEKVDVKYLISEATCVDCAVYYKSCVCGEKGTEGFLYGNTIPHSFSNENPSNDFLCSSANCTYKATYYKSCVCGEKGTEIFEYGELGDHQGGTATCVDKKICDICGVPYGSLSGQHTLSEQWFAEKGQHWKECIIDNCDEIRGAYGNGPENCRYNEDGVCTICDESWGFVFELNDNNNGYVLVDYIGDDPTTEIPTLYRNLPVVEIADSVFENAEFIITVEFHDTIEKIGEKAFAGCSNMVEIYCTNHYYEGAGQIEAPKLNKIGRAAFEECNSLTRVRLTQTSITEISERLFYGCDNLSFVDFSDKVTKIGTSAFSYCTKLEFAGGSDYCATISAYAFYNCTNMKMCDIGRVETVGPFAFENCSSLETFDASTARIIDTCAFLGCKNLKTVDLGSTTGNLQSIGASAFYECEKLELLLIPDTVTYIGFGAFRYCTELKEIYIKSSFWGLYDDDYCVNTVQIQSNPNDLTTWRECATYLVSTYVDYCWKICV